MSDSLNKLRELDALIQRADRLLTQVHRRKIHLHQLLETLVVSFLEREAEYAKSVKRLVEVGEVASAAVLTRTMLEGAACFHWVLKSDDPHGRAEKWRAYVYHESLKLLDEHEPTNPEMTNAYNTKREAQRLQARGETFKERRWTVDEQGKHWWPRDLLENLVETEPHMKRSVYAYYQGLSAFVHWSPKGFCLDREKMLVGEWVSAEFPDGYVSTALGTAYLSLLVVAVLTAGHFDIPRS